MDQNLVRAGFDKYGRVTVRVLDHQVNVQGHPGDLAKRRHHRRTKGEIGHEMPVHHVHMEHPAAGGFELRHLLAQAGKIRREDGWKNLDHELGDYNGICYHSGEKAIPGVAAGEPQVGFLARQPGD